MNGAEGIDCWRLVRVAGGYGVGFDGLGVIGAWVGGVGEGLGRSRWQKGVDKRGDGKG